MMHSVVRCQGALPRNVGRPCDCGVPVQALGVAANKTQLTREGVGFLKDPFTLSFYNVSDETTLSVRVRMK